MQSDPNIITGSTAPGGAGMQATEDSLKANNSSNSGTTAPSYAEDGTPFYDTATDTLYFQINGSMVAVAGTGSGNVVGEVKAFAMTVPSLWLAMDGTAKSRTTYAALFAAIGTTYGVGDGSTTFNLPNSLGRTLIDSGSGSGLTARTLADSSGFETHQLTEAEMPSHSHTMGYPRGSSGSYGLMDSATASSTGTGNTAAAGSDTAHNNMQPYLVLNYAIYAGV